ncbi:hypothetical protein SAMN03159496_04733 [Rhizobium sp. NFR07]|uniref:hypothetical protein n=1 Tax=Rhizobium sp. NFR07 TaxID=1566262 RepID=UPI0008E5CA31|nr:hypothetical protein [Rhizobium sp. NFR07]SFB53007.1 hypothetical protein SAMN03159496_04733 [Rhizobium sp. NFR07]
MSRCMFIALLLVCSVTPAAAQQAIPWKSSGDWDILMDQTMGNACYVTAAYEDGTVIRLGFNFLENERTMYLAIGNAKWKSLEDSKDYEISVTFDNRTPWKAAAVGSDFASAKWLFINGLKGSFANEFARKHSVRVHYNGREIVNLRLKGSSKAIDEMIACQTTVNEVTSGKPQQPTTPAPSPQDPFSAAPNTRNASDPFDM